MSVKHIKEYYEQVCDQYNEMIQNLKDFEEYAKTNIVSPEQIDNMKKLVEPIKTNYMTLSYIIFLLNTPNKKEKKDKYIKQHKKHLKKIGEIKSKDDILNEGKEILEKMNEGSNNNG